MKVWDLHDKEDIKAVSEFKTWHSDDVYSIGLIDNDQRLVTASFDKSIKIFDLSNPLNIEEITKCGKKNEQWGKIRTMAISKDGKFIAIGSHNNDIRIFTVGEDKMLTEISHLFKCHTHWVVCLCFSQRNDGSVYLYSGAKDKNLVIHCIYFDTDSNKYMVEQIYTKKIHQKTFYCICSTTDDFYLFTGSKDQTINLFDVSEKNRIDQLNTIDLTDSEDALVTSLTVSKRCPHLFAGFKDLSIKVYDFTGIKKINLIYNIEQAHEFAINCITPTSCDSFMYTCSTDKSIKVFDLRYKENVYKSAMLENTHKEFITCLLLTSNDKYLLTTSHDRYIKVYDVTDKTNPTPLKDNDEWPQRSGHNILHMALTSDDMYLFVVGKDKKVTVFDITDIHNFKLVGCIKDKHENEIIKCVISHDDKWLATVDSDAEAKRGNVKIFDITDTNNMKIVRDISHYHLDVINDMQLTTDDKWLITASKDKSVKWLHFGFFTKNLNVIYDDTTVIERKNLHVGGVNAMTLSNDDSLLFTGGADKIIKIFDITDMQNIAHINTIKAIKHNYPINSLCMSANSHYLYTGSGP